MQSSPLTQGYGQPQNLVRGGMGVTTVYGTGTLSPTHSALQVVGQATVPSFQANASVILKNVLLNALSSNTIPVYTGISDLPLTVNFGAGGGEDANYLGNVNLLTAHLIGASGILVLPVYTGRSDYNITHPLIFGSASQFVPIYSGAASLSYLHDIVGTANSIIGIYKGSGNIAISHVSLISPGDIFISPVYSSVLDSEIETILTSRGQFIVPVYSANLYSSVTPIAYSANGTFVLPIYTGNVSLINHPTLSLLATNIYRDFHYDMIVWVIMR